MEGSIQETGANRFRSGRWCSSQWTGSHHRCILEQRCEYSRDRTSAHDFGKKRIRDDFMPCKCGKLRRPNQDGMNRIKEAFQILMGPYYRTSMIVTRGSKCSTNPWQQHHHKARDALRSATKVKVHLLQSGTDGKMMRPAVNLSLLIIGRMHGSGTWTTSCTSTSGTTHRNRREKDTWTYCIYEVLANTKQAPLL